MLISAALKKKGHVEKADIIENAIVRSSLLTDVQLAHI